MLTSQQENLIDQGKLLVQITDRNRKPVKDASITLSYTGIPDLTLEQLTTDSSGLSQELSLRTPPLEYSLDKNNIEQPYSEYSIYVEAEGYEPVALSGIQLLSGTFSRQPVSLNSLSPSSEPSEVTFPAHTLYGNYPAKIPESEIKPIGESGEIVLSRVVVPETVIVHDGAPSDSTAKDYYVSYTDYIKNVASSEIYATWPESTITANVLAIMSFTLNRVYTEWYRNQGYSFTITSSTAFDHKWIYGRNIFDSISSVVDNIFNRYLKRAGVRQPLLTQYCDGKRVTCPGWMSQWGSKDLGDAGFSTIEILQNYYGSSIIIETADAINGIPSSWPGYNLSIGSSGVKVSQLQEQLNGIASAYPEIPFLSIDGIYGTKTANAVKEFQRIFGLTPTGVTDFKTWYKVSQIYTGVTKIAELNGTPIQSPTSISGE